ncbi:MAG: diaminopimelate decarboxylase [Nitrososphaerota archaeon]
MYTSILDHFKVEGNRLLFDGVDLLSIVEKYGTPIFIFSESRLKENAKFIQESFRKEYRETYIHYALKANSILSILKIFKDEGLKCEVSSTGELYKAIKAGFNPEDIIYNSPGKRVEDLYYAVKSRINCINVDSFYEMMLLNNIASELNLKVGISLRVVPEVMTPTLKTGISRSKFGFEIGELFKAYRLALELKNIDIKGIHAHIGSQISDLTSWENSSRTIVDIVNQLYNDLKIELDHINLGGGIPVDYTKTLVEEDNELPAYYKVKFDIHDIARTISTNLRRLKYDVKLYIEPGRSLVADACILLTRIVNFKERSSGEKWLIVDAGFNILPSARILRWYYPILNVSRIDEKHDTSFRIGGPLCDAEDVYHDVEGEENGFQKLPRYRRLPGKTSPGDVLAFLHTGAYGPEVMMNFNGMLRPPYLMILRNGDVKIIRRRDELDDLYRYEEF